MAIRPFGTLARWMLREALSSVDGPPGPWDRPPSRSGNTTVTPDTALRQSAVWACLRLRADLMSTFPVDAFREIDNINVEVPKPPILVSPGGKRWKYHRWMYASQFDLDRCGNTVGLITETYGSLSNPLPARIDLVPPSEVSIRQKKGQPDPIYVLNGKEYPADKVWHEIQFPVSGLHVGLSPLAYAAWSLSESLTIDEFVRDWFGKGGIPRARLRNKQRKVPPDDAKVIKERYYASVQTGDLFVHGADWEYDLMRANEMGMEWLEQRKASVPDIARYFGCPSDLIDAAVSGQSITYANISQRNLQFLIMNLGPAVFRREVALSDWLPRPRFVKLNTDALVRMDPLTRARMNRILIESRQRTPSEVRAKDDLQPYTPEQMKEFEDLFGKGAEDTRTGTEREPGGDSGENEERAQRWERVSPYSAVPLSNGFTIGGTYE